MRACRGVSGGDGRVQRGTTHSHLSPLDLPFVSVAFVSAPFGLQEVQHAREREVLSALWGQRDFGGLGALLLLRALLLALLHFLLHLEVGTQHRELDARVLERKEVGRASLCVWSRRLPRVDLHPVDCKYDCRAG